MQQEYEFILQFFKSFIVVFLSVVDKSCLKSHSCGEGVEYNMDCRYYTVAVNGVGELLSLNF